MATKVRFTTFINGKLFVVERGSVPSRHKQFFSTMTVTNDAINELKERTDALRRYL
jgi:hypothetical protein